MVRLLMVPILASVMGCTSSGRQVYDPARGGAPMVPAVESLLERQENGWEATVERWVKYKDNYSHIDETLTEIAWDVATGEPFPGRGASHVHYAMDSYLALWVNFEYDESKGYNVITEYDVYRNGGWIKDGGVLEAVHYDGRWMRRVAVGHFEPIEE